LWSGEEETYAPFEAVRWDGAGGPAKRKRVDGGGKQAAVRTPAKPAVAKPRPRTPFTVSRPLAPISDEYLDLVWVKTSGWPWWPALTLPPTMFGNVDRTQLQVPSTGPLKYVMFVGWSPSEAFAISADVVSWETGTARGYRADARTPKLQGALRIADDSLGLAKSVRGLIVAKNTDALIAKYRQVTKAAGAAGAARAPPPARPAVPPPVRPAVPPPVRPVPPPLRRAAAGAATHNRPPMSWPPSPNSGGRDRTAEGAQALVGLDV